MGTVWIKEFLGGLDARRLPETTPGGVLIQGLNGHITRGGEFEKRAAFVNTYTLPNGTVGLHKTRTGLIVFGSDAPPVMPSGVTYQRLQHPTNPAIQLVNVPSVDLYSGRVYAVAEFADGSRFHYYDGVRVEDWFDGRARATFQVVNGSVTSAVAAKGTLTVTGGTVGVGNEITDVQVNSVSIISGPINFTTSNSVTASAIAAAINSYASSPEYTATASGATVTITAATVGAASNGFTVSASASGDVTTTTTPLSGGADAATSTLTSLTINGIAAINAPVLWATSNSATATSIANRINSDISDPDYEAVAVNDQVVILAVSAGIAPNGRSVVTTVTNGLQLSPASGLVMSGGVDLANVYEPGTFVKTIQSKMYSVSGPNLHFSGIQEPTQWTTDAVGAGFIDMSSYESGSEELKAVARYQNNIAIFAETNVQIWFVDPDPALNRQVQVLGNTGTVSPRSVTQFSDNDLFYLSESGLRSLRAREATTSASTTDIGVPIDSLIADRLRVMNQSDRDKVIGLIEPQEGRFWLVMGRDIFVFSFFSGASVSAWSQYRTSVTSSGTTSEFDVDGAVVFNRRIYLRAGNTIYAYGGLAETPVYDETEAVAQIPYLDADDPTRKKNWQAIDAAAQGVWGYSASLLSKYPSAQDFVANVDGSSFEEGGISMLGWSTHISVTARSRGEGYARLGSFILHYESSGDEDGG